MGDFPPLPFSFSAPLREVRGLPFRKRTTDSTPGLKAEEFF